MHRREVLAEEGDQALRRRPGGGPFQWRWNCRPNAGWCAQRKFARSGMIRAVPPSYRDPVARIFLSYARPDERAVRRIANALCADHHTWLDQDDILVGESIVAAVERGLHDADFVVLCLSKAAAARGWIEAERDATLMQQFGERRERILPVRLEDNAKLTDFDLVGAHDTTGGTRTGALGTVVYAAPECLDKPQEATARADVFGLGMTAIFCLSGRELSMATFRNPAETVAQLDCSVPVQNVLERAVAWEPAERFADAEAMIDALRDALNAGSSK